MNLFDPEFYPTPDAVIEKMAAPYAGCLHTVTILEPSAGNGAILDFLTRKGVYYETETARGSRYSDYAKADPEKVYAIEKNDELTMILQQKGYKVIAPDFLTFRPEHRFSLILMNPPFKTGAEHLLHAWDILQGGDIACLLNAETIRNACNGTRTRLAAIIKEHGSVEFIGKAFKSADNPTDVEVALVRLHKDAKEDPFTFIPGTAAHEGSPDFSEMAASKDELAVSSRLDAYIRCWDLTKEAAARFIRAYGEFIFYAKAFIGDGDQERSLSRSSNMVEAILKNLVNMRYSRDSMSTVYNRFIDTAKAGAWGAIFDQIGLGKYMTTGLQQKLNEFRTAQGAMSITKENVMYLFRFIMANITKIMDQSVIEVYDMFTRYFKGNTSHDEGWKTNKRFKCNRKVILPDAVSAGYEPQRFGYDKYFSVNYQARLDDIDKAMCHLTGRNFDSLVTGRVYGSDFRMPSGPNHSITSAICTIPVGSTGWHESAFFRIKAFKKGTIHLEFKEEDLWNRFNIAVNDGKKELGMKE